MDRRCARARSRAGIAFALLAGASACGHREPAPNTQRAQPAQPSPSAPEAAAASGSPGVSAPATSAGSQDEWFEDITEAAGLAFVHDAGSTPEKHLLETMGGGAVLFDVELDGDLDVYCVQSGPVPVGAARVRTPQMPASELHLNDGRARFRRAPAGAAEQRAYGQAAAAGDLDGDALPDLFVANFGPDALYLNEGAARFRDATPASGIGSADWSAGALLFDADNDGDLDLYVTTYVKIDVDAPAWCGRREPGLRQFCHPDQYPPQQDRFWLNDGAGGFSDATASCGIDGNPGKGLGAIACDFDADGKLDVYVAHDSVENKLWRNLGGARFSDATLESGTGVDGNGRTEAGMGLGTGDYDGDLDLDLLVSNFDEESNTLYRNDGGLLFADATMAAGLEAASRPPVGWGIALEDFDLDGDLDLAVANGHIIDNIALYHDGKTHAQRAQLFANDGRGRYRELGREAGPLAEPRVGRGLYAGDLDGDGRADLLAMECGGPARIFRNRLGGSSLALRGLPRNTQLVLTLSSGARRLRETGPQPSYYGQSADEVLLALPAGERLAAVSWSVPGAQAAQSASFEPTLGPGVLRFERTAQGWTSAHAPRSAAKEAARANESAR
jgi:hypothetical protein